MHILNIWYPHTHTNALESRSTCGSVSKYEYIPASGYDRHAALF